ncbi:MULTISPECIES: lysozyme [Acidithiobacillus]|uniref:lysozyme n=1 Tax=Acidithiobacillus TaxID=119977 RepID=UPI001178A8D0|nr:MULTISPECIES: lysozyme [Acidithiobacillus]MDD5279752.1 hypothetical protein [Acidithiobacillus sp.]
MAKEEFCAKYPNGLSFAQAGHFVKKFADARLATVLKNIHVQLNQNQINALADIIYNFYGLNSANDKLIEDINNCSLPSIMSGSTGFLFYDLPTTITNRHKEEADLWNSGNYGNDTINSVPTSRYLFTSCKPLKKSSPKKP